MQSLPSRERGLKSLERIYNPKWENVAPLAGAWIEIRSGNLPCSTSQVAPLAGAWIEMEIKVMHSQFVYCRSPRGSVD